MAFLPVWSTLDLLIGEWGGVAWVHEELIDISFSWSNGKLTERFEAGVLLSTLPNTFIRRY